MRLLKMMLKANGKKGVPQGGIISPLLSNVYLNGIDHMFVKAITETKNKGYQQIEYCRFADDMVILINGHPALSWLVEKAKRRLVTSYLRCYCFSPRITQIYPLISDIKTVILSKKPVTEGF